MPTQILRTKLYIPPPRPHSVSRPHLIARLDYGLRTGNKLTLVSAPAGFGKSTLLSEWIHSSGRSCAWLSLDEADDSLPRLLAYIIVALQTVITDLGAELLPALQPTNVPANIPANIPANVLPIEPLLTELLNELAAMRDPITLVLDDYHVIEETAIDSALTFLLDHLPPQVHLVIMGRADPALPLARLRARRELTELRTADLRFTPEEVAAFLNSITGLLLDPETIAALEEQTEGWITGLQLAALSLEGATNSTDLLTSLRDSNRYILDYLTDEVLQKRPPGTQEFLLKTSILERLCAPLCDAILDHGEPEQGRMNDVLASKTGSLIPAAQATIEQLERANLFLIPLDGERRWYRYHHLFAGLLRQRLQQQQPAHVAELHRRASHWFEENDLLPEAFDHAIAADDFPRAATIVATHYSALYRRGEGNVVAEWFARLPQPIVLASHTLCLARSWISYFGQRPQETETYLARIEELIADDSVNPFERRRFTSSVAGLRGWAAYATGHVDEAIALCHAALALAEPDQDSWRGLVTLFLAGALREQGATDHAAAVAREGIAICRAAGNLSAGLGAVYHLAESYRLLGNLGEAQAVIDEALAYAATHNALRSIDVGYVLVAQAELHYERNELDACQQVLDRCAEITRWRSTKSTVPASVCRAWLYWAQGKQEEAHEALMHAQRELRSWQAQQEATHIAAQIAVLQLALGETAAVEHWQQESRIDQQNPVTYANELVLMTVARIQITEQRGQKRPAPTETLALLERLYDNAEAAERRGRVIQIRVLQALAFSAAGDDEQALAMLGEALVLGEPAGYVRTFVDEHAPMAQLLYKAAKQKIAPIYVGQLLAAFNADLLAEQTPAQSAQQRMANELVEPLSAREIEVLQLVADGHTNQEIANELVLTLGTVKVHTRNIYGKLSVSSRTQAVSKARAFGIV